MNVSPMAGIALAFAATAAQAAPLAHDAEVADALVRACVESGADYAGTVRLLTESGWAIVPDDSHPTVAAVLAESKALSQTAEAPPGWQVLYTTLTKQIDGQDYYFIASEASATDLAAAQACRIMNFDATAPFDPQAMQARLGLGNPDHREEHGFIVDSWAPPSDPLQVTILFGDPVKADPSLSPVKGVSITLAN